MMCFSIKYMYNKLFNISREKKPPNKRKKINNSQQLLQTSASATTDRYLSYWDFLISTVMILLILSTTMPADKLFF